MVQHGDIRTRTPKESRTGVPTTAKFLPFDVEGISFQSRNAGSSRRTATDKSSARVVCPSSECIQSGPYLGVGGLEGRFCPRRSRASRGSGRAHHRRRRRRHPRHPRHYPGITSIPSSRVYSSAPSPPSGTRGHARSTTILVVLSGFRAPSLSVSFDFTGPDSCPIVLYRTLHGRIQITRTSP